MKCELRKLPEVGGIEPLKLVLQLYITIEVMGSSRASCALRDKGWEVLLSKT